MKNIKTAQLSRPVTLGKRALLSLCAIAVALLLPQLLHISGALIGVDRGLGEALLPMHLPIMLVGLVAGSLAGIFSGLISPLVSFAFTSLVLGTAMPSFASLPFMMVELGVYGAICGLLADKRMPVA